MFDNDKIRQVTIGSYNNSVSLFSNYEEETMDYLIERATKIFDKIKENGGDK